MNGNNANRADTIIDEVLSRDEFNRTRRRVDASWISKIAKAILKFINDLLEKIWKWFIKLIRKLFGIDFGTAGGNAKTVEVIAKIVIAVLAVAAVVLITMLIIRLLRGRKLKAEEAADNEELASFASDPDAALALAERYRAEGNVRMSFRYLFINLLTEFNRLEIIKIAKFKTNRSYLREAEASGRIDIRAVTPFFNTFNRVWYGGKDLKSEALDEFFEERKSLLAAVEPKPAEKGGDGDG